MGEVDSHAPTRACNLAAEMIDTEFHEDLRRSTQSLLAAEERGERIHGAVAVNPVFGDRELLRESWTVNSGTRHARCDRPGRGHAKEEAVGGRGRPKR